MKEELEKELSMVDEELEYLFKRFEELIERRRSIVNRIKSKGESKEREKFIRHVKHRPAD